jgi:ribosomal protein S18 acetylase RimI-like enzyme
MEVRPVRAGEHRAAGRLVVAAYRALNGHHMTGGYEVELADVARRAAEAEVFVAVDGPDLLGCVTFVPDATNPWAEELQDGEASIRMLAVDPAVQGRGAGAALLESCIGRARTLGRIAVFLHSTPWMRAAHRLYEKAGFVRVPDRDWLPIPEVPLLAFRLDLPGRAPEPASRVSSRD